MFDNSFTIINKIFTKSYKLFEFNNLGKLIFTNILLYAIVLLSLCCNLLIRNGPMILGIKFKLNESLFHRDPQDTNLGQRIIKHSIVLIDELGIEAFTFKKLAKEIKSTEASIYRYFDNKHLLLLFLTTWYWEWVHYLIKINIKNIQDPKRKLKLALMNIVQATEENTMTEYVNENLLHKIIVKEGSKSYHTASVDDENKNGLFASYKNLVSTIADIMFEINPEFPYNHSLASNLFEMSNNQIFFAEHLPKLTDLKANDQSNEELLKMLDYFVFKLLK